MNVRETSIPGLLELLPVVRRDERGHLVKTFEREAYRDAGLPVEFAEELHTFSRAGVLRGMHFQTPPAGQGKVVFCELGSVLDAIVDLRAGSPAYGAFQTFELSGDGGNGLWVPEGLAHGFCVTAEAAIVSYRLTAPYSPQHDAGVRWDSVGIAWPTADPIVSERDRSFPALAEYGSPFVFTPARPI